MTAEWIPWIEVYPPHGEDTLDALAALPVWARSCKRAIVSTDPAQVELYVELERLRPAGLSIIPGLKTSPILIPSGFDSPEGWAKIWDTARLACALTGNPLIVLEHESAIAAYLKGDATLDWRRLRQALRQAPADLEVWWYPSMAGAGETLARYLRLALAVQEALGERVRFLDHAALFGPRHVGTPATLACVGELEGAAARPVIPMIYTHAAGWPVERIGEALDHVSGELAVVYPGRSNWMAAARAASELNRPDAKDAERNLEVT